MQDAYAIQSNERGIAARDSGAFAWEIVPVFFFYFFCFFDKVSNCYIICFPNVLSLSSRLKFLLVEGNLQYLLTKMRA